MGFLVQWMRVECAWAVGSRMERRAWSDRASASTRSNCRFSHLLRVASLVGVVLDGRLAVRLLDLAGIRVLGHAEDVVKLLGVALMFDKKVWRAMVSGWWSVQGGRGAARQKEDPGRTGRRRWVTGAPWGDRACRRNASGRLFFLAGLSLTLESGEFTTKLALRRRPTCGLITCRRRRILYVLRRLVFGF